MPSNHLILCHPLLLLPSIFPSIRVFFSKLALYIKWPKYWSFSFSISPSNEYSGLICFRMDRFDCPCCPRDSQEFSPAPQLKSINSSALSLLDGPTLTSVHDYWNNYSFDYMDLCQQSNAFVFEVCHSFPSKEQASLNFMAVVTVHSEFGAQICHCFHFFPILI